MDWGSIRQGMQSEVESSNCKPEGSVTFRWICYGLDTNSLVDWRPIRLEMYSMTLWQTLSLKTIESRPYKTLETVTMPNQIPRKSTSDEKM